MKFVIPGKPEGKGRPRFTKFGKVYTPKKTADYENLCKQIYIISGGKKSERPISMRIDAYFAFQKKMPLNSEKILERDILNTSKPDVDNIGKIIMDSLNGVAYKDDKQVVELHVYKHFGDPRCEVQLEEI